MTQYFLAIVWTLALVVGFAGWGAFIGRVALGRWEGDLGERVAWGLALAIALGGMANLFHLLSPWALIGFVAIGFLAFIVDGADRLRSRSLSAPGRSRGWGERLLIALAVVLATFRLAASAQTTVLSTLDDHSAYLAFSVQMLQVGGLTNDPFCDRRLETTLGGMSLLNAFALAAFAEESVKLIDLGVGFLAVIAASVGLFRSRGIVGLALLVPVFLVELDRPPANNLTAIVVPIALLLAIHRMLGRDEQSLGRAAILGLLASALVSLKSTLFPIAFFVFAIDFLLRLHRRSAWRALLVEVLVGLVALLPWMISLKQSSGTYLYPLLGKGVHGTQYGTLLKPDAELQGESLLRNVLLGLTDPVSGAALVSSALTLAILAGRRREVGSRRPEDLAFLLAPLPTILLMLRMFDRAQSNRYTYSLEIASMIVALCVLCQGSGNLDRDRLGRAFALACLMFFLGAKWVDTRVFYQAGVVNIRAGLAGSHYVDPADRAAYSAMQASVPEGEAILTRLGQSYLMDFRRNPVYLADWPGGASPAPGLPFFQGPEAVADYLKTRGIRYVAYSYVDQANLPKREIEPVLPTWDRTVIEHAFDFQDNLEALMQSRVRAFDDGRLVVIDLARPSGR